MNYGKYLNKFVDFLFPQDCIICNKTGEIICKNCKDMAFKQNEIGFCFMCNKLSKLNICIKCKENSELDMLFTLTTYTNPYLKLLLYNYKVLGTKSLSIHIASGLDYYIKTNNTLANCDIITSVPSHTNKIKSRGFDNMGIILNDLDKLVEHKNINGLIKTKNISQTSTKDRINREKQSHDCYKLRSNNLYTNNKVVLIDDVFTTGTTLNACAKAIKYDKPKCVYGLIIAYNDSWN